MFEEIQEKLKKSLNESRFEHTLGVMYTAGSLAMAHGYDINKAMLAGLLHDCAKCMKHEEHLDLCEKYHISVSGSELENEALLHAKVGALLAKIEYNVDDAEILHAIEIHTTGDVAMNTLDKIIYIADYIEPCRNKAPNLEYIRTLAFQDLNACVAKILGDTLDYLLSNYEKVDIATAIAEEYYREYRKDV